MTPVPLYVSCAGSREVQAFVLDPRDGKLTLAQRLPLPGAVLHLKLTPDRQILLAGTRDEDALHAMAVTPTYGTLRRLGSTPSPGAPTYVGIAPERDLAFVASYGNNLLATFPLARDGAPGAARHVLHELPRAHAAVSHARGWLLVPTLAADTIRVYALTPSARAPLTPAVPPSVAVRPGSGPRHLVFSENQQRAYCLNELDNSLDAFDFNADNGQLLLRQSLSLRPPGNQEAPWAAELRLSPSGRFLYATDRRSSTLACVAIAPDDGRLALIGHFATETQQIGRAHV